MTSTGSYEDLFRKETTKYNHICEEISQNLQTQEQLLIYIQGQNRQFADTFNIEDYKGNTYSNFVNHNLVVSIVYLWYCNYYIFSAACEKCYKHIDE